jgi:hypothetical protein
MSGEIKRIDHSADPVEREAATVHDCNSRAGCTTYRGNRRSTVNQECAKSDGPHSSMPCGRLVSRKRFAAARAENGLSELLRQRG